MRIHNGVVVKKIKGRRSKFEVESLIIEYLCWILVIIYYSGYSHYTMLMVDSNANEKRSRIHNESKLNALN